MRLLKAGLVRAAAAMVSASARAQGAALGVFVCWSESDFRLPADYVLADGEYVAVDLDVLGPPSSSTVFARERVTRDPYDLGIVRCEGEMRIGVVSLIDGDLIEWVRVGGGAVRMVLPGLSAG